MNTKQSLLTTDQKLLIAELQAAYGIDPNEVIFFSDDAEPFFGYEATCVLCDKLTDLRDINIEPFEQSFVDSLSLRCTLTLQDGRTRSAVGVVNVNEQIDGVTMTTQQLYATASARAIRNALRTAGINLLRNHEYRKTNQPGGVAFAHPPLDERQRLLREVHALGLETGYIIGTDKSAWHQVLSVRYGVEASSDLGVELLRNFAAFLRSQLPTAKAAA